MAEMKTLTFPNGIKYEVVDAESRSNIETINENLDFMGKVFTTGSLSIIEIEEEDEDIELGDEDSSEDEDSGTESEEESSNTTTSRKSYLTPSSISLMLEKEEGDLEEDRESYKHFLYDNSMDSQTITLTAMADGGNEVYLDEEYEIQEKITTIGSNNITFLDLGLNVAEFSIKTGFNKDSLTNTITPRLYLGDENIYLGKEVFNTDIFSINRRTYVTDIISTNSKWSISLNGLARFSSINTTDLTDLDDETNADINSNWYINDGGESSFTSITLTNDDGTIKIDGTGIDGDSNGVLTKFHSIESFNFVEDGKSLSEKYATKADLDDISGGGASAQSITYAELVALRDEGNLVAGTQYRITDYVTTTTQYETQSAGNQFDVIVRADDESTLNENAFAIQHDGDTYFANSNLDAWKLKYCIDNDTNRFLWADSTNGKGVIYEMIDEFDNKCGYDFKNIQFKRFKITATTTSVTSVVNTYFGAREIISSTLFPNNCTISTSDTKFVYTFDYNGNDYSLNLYSNVTTVDNKKIGSKYCQKNEISDVYTTYYYNGSSRVSINDKGYILPNNVFAFNSTSSTCFENKIIGRLSHSNTFGGSCYSNTLKRNCSNNVFGDTCHSNIFGIGCEKNLFGGLCYGNTFGNYASNNTIKASCQFNLTDTHFQYNTFGTNCNINTFKKYFKNNTFGNSCSQNAFGENCSSNTFGNSCSYNTFGNNCSSNTFSSSCSSNTFGNNCSSNTLNSSCSSNTFGNNCSVNTLQDSCARYSFSNPNFLLYFNTTTTVSYSYSSWATSTTTSGSSTVSGINGLKIKVINEEGEVTYHLRLDLFINNKYQDTLYDADITTKSGSFETGSLNYTWSNTSASGVIIIYTLTREYRGNTVITTGTID